MVKRAHISWLLSALLVGALLLIIGGAVLVHYLPRYLESNLIPQIANQAGIQPISCRIRKIGINGFDVADVVIGKEEEGGLYINAIRFDYSVSGIFKRRIDRVVVDGIELPLEFDNGSLRLKGVHIPRKTPASPTERPSSDAPPLHLNVLSIRNATIRLYHNTQYYRIPFNLDVSGVTSIRPFFDTARIRLYPRGQELVITAETEPKDQLLIAAFKTDSADLDRFADIISQFPDLRLQGLLDARGQMSLRVDPPELVDIRAECQIRNWTFDFSDIRLTGQGPGQNLAREPLNISVQHSKSSTITFSGEKISVVEPVEIDIPSVNLTMSAENWTVKGEGLISLSIPPCILGCSEASEELPSIQLHSRVKGALDRSGIWKTQIESFQPDDNRAPEWPGPQMTIGGAVLTSDIPSYQITARGDQTWAEATFDLNLPSMRADSGAATLKTAALKLSGNGAFSTIGNTTSPPVINLNLTASPISLTGHSMDFRLPELVMEGQATRDFDQRFRFNGHTVFSKGRFSHPESGLRIAGISGKIPWRWPVHSTSDHGRLRIKSIRWGKFNIGSLAATLRQVPMGIDLKGEYVSRLISDMTIGFAGSADLTQLNTPRAELNFYLNRFRPAADIDLGDFVAGADGKTLNGQIDLNARASLSQGGFNGSLNLSVEDARFNDQKTGLLATGIRGNLHFPVLPNVRSAPAQHVEVDTVRIGKLTATEGAIDFQIEPGGAFFLEKGEFRWCEGKIFSQAMRIVPGRNVYDLILFCDRLKLADLLGQIGELQAEGAGTVNGRIPIRIQGGDISFEDGFLYSTPGSGGVIRLTGADILLADIPSDTPQFAQIDLAQEALKNYSYNWVKLSLDTEEQNLLLRMQLDGKPVDPLPFVPRRDSGGFVRVGDDHPGSRFQGIGLDVNFRLPLNKILHYGGSMMEIFNP